MNKEPVKVQIEILRCPVCKCKLKSEDQSQHLQCEEPSCGMIYPIINGIPCLINEKNSVFQIDDFIHYRDLFFQFSKRSILKDVIKKILPSISNNIKAKKNYKYFAEKHINNISNPRVLVLGGGVLGHGMKAIISYTNIEFIETDVSLGPRTMLICDAHDIPFENDFFDGVIVQAVLEHVADPYRCVEEIYRVLKSDGYIYAESPFIQQVHGREYDFTRFTYLGHRRLFRYFKEIESGSVCGPGMALAWSYKYFLLSFFQSRLIRKIVGVFADLTAFYLKYFDYYLVNKNAALDAASGFYFMGQKAKTILSDKEIIRLYKGGF